MHKEKSFDWDDGNIGKILKRFRIEFVEEFFRQELLVIPDSSHSTLEERMIAVGLAPDGKPMFVCYTLRKDKIRVISARYMNRNEAKKYEKLKEK